jgi:hypothetical protein
MVVSRISTWAGGLQRDGRAGEFEHWVPFREYANLGNNNRFDS